MALSLYKTPKQDPQGLCVYDHPAKRVLDGKSVTGLNDLTLEKCSAFCANYKFFGLQGGDECHCGDYDDNFLPSSPIECNQPCTGDGNICGGSWRMNVFLNEESALLSTSFPLNTTADLIELYTTTESTWPLDALTTAEPTAPPAEPTAPPAAGWSLEGHFQISEENFEISEDDVEDDVDGSGKDMFVLGDQDDKTFTYFSTETYQREGHVLPLEFENSLITTNSPSFDSTTDATYTIYTTPESYTEQYRSKRRFQRHHRSDATTVEPETTDDPTRQPIVGGLLCSRYYCKESRWMSRDSPAGTGDHERFE